jgi:serine/threonine protein kinase
VTFEAILPLASEFISHNNLQSEMAAGGNDETGFPSFEGMTIGDYEIQDRIKLSSGNSIVYHCKRKGDATRKFVFKWILPTVPLEKVINELRVNEILVNVPHAAVAFEIIDNVEGAVGLVMPYYGGGDLCQHIWFEGPLSEDLARTISFHVLVCLCHMHSMGIVHRDIKPDNIFLENGDPPEAFLGDFGLSMELEREQIRDPVGSCPYYAPEMMLSKPCGFPADMWAFGVTLYMMLTKKVPFTRPGDNYGKFKKDVCAGNYDKGTLLECGVSDDAIDLIESLLTVDQGNRITCEDAKLHLFYAKAAESEIKGLRAPDEVKKAAEEYTESAEP